MATFKRVLRTILVWFGLPGDFHWWWTVVCPLLGAGMIDAIFAFVRDAPFWQLLIAFIAVYAAILVVGTQIRRRATMAGQGGGEREQSHVSGEVHISAGGDVTNYGEIAGVIQKFGTQARTLADEDVEAAITRLASYPGTVAQVGPVPGVPDGTQLARAILTLLQQAHWEPGPVGSINVGSSTGFLPPGVLIDCTAAPDCAPFEELCRVLNDLGVRASLTNWGFPWPAVVVSDQE